MNPMLLGIMHCKTSSSLPFGESKYFRELTILGWKYGITVYTFCPKEVRWSDRTVLGYEYSSTHRKWEQKRFPLPKAIYDRCFYGSSKHFQSYQPAVKKLRDAGIQFLGYGLKGKWQVHEILSKIPSMVPYLPGSRIVWKASDIQKEWSDQPVVIKPKAGSQGKGIYRLELTGKGISMTGRDPRNRSVHQNFTMDQASGWLRKILSPGRYIVQPYLNLTTKDHRAFDIRSLVQKNGKGEWSLTGMAVRCGKPRSLTSNLHGGGDVYPVEPFLKEQFGHQAVEITNQLRSLSIEVCEALEKEHGRLVEVGVDLGIDRSGRIWLLEANSKPGRAVFRKITDVSSSRTSVESIIAYAKNLLSRN
jgi:glutathione synthase/RimK-type ligase-like ATP-grasp enzyme